MPLPWPRFLRRDAVFVTDSGPFYGREAIEKFRVGLFKERHFSHHLIKTDPNSPAFSTWKFPFAPPER
jgi:hypothetical protein